MSGPQVLRVMAYGFFLLLGLWGTCLPVFGGDKKYAFYGAILTVLCNIGLRLEELCIH